MDYEKTRDVYSMCIKLIPHKKFTFAKVWLMFAKFEIRQKKVSNARKILVIQNFNFSYKVLLNLLQNNNYTKR